MLQTSRAAEIARLLVVACDQDYTKARRVACTAKAAAEDDMQAAETPGALAQADRTRRYWIAVVLRVDRLAKIAAACAQA